MTTAKERREAIKSSAAFASAAQPVSARRQAITAAFDNTPTVAAVEHIALNPKNPREKLPNIPALAESLRVRQIAPIIVMTREAFLAAKPEWTEDDVPASARYVALDGNRRVAAAELANLKTLEIKVGDGLASSPEEILLVALIASAHTEKLTPMEYARAINQLVEVYGPRSQSRVAQELAISEATVSNYLSMFRELTPEMRDKVDAGEVTVREARTVATERTVPEAQPERIRQLREQAAAEKRAARAAKVQTQSAAPTDPRTSEAPESALKTGAAGAVAEPGNLYPVEGTPDTRERIGDVEARPSLHPVKNNHEGAPDPAPRDPIRLTLPPDDVHAVAEQLKANFDAGFLHSLAELLA